MKIAFPIWLIAFCGIVVSGDLIGVPDARSIKYMKSITEAIRSLFPATVLHDASEELNGNRTAQSAECLAQISLIQRGLENTSLWALRMLDSSSKIPSGILIGNRIDYGMFDECIDVKANVSGHNIRGRHCMYDLHPQIGGDLPIVETLSICVPAVCNSRDVKKIIEKGLEMIRYNISITVGEIWCTTVDPQPWSTGFIMSLAGIAVLLLFLFVCTICDIFSRCFKEKLSPNETLENLSKFSLILNAEYLLSLKPSSETLDGIQGLRFFSMCWVMLGHAHVMFIQGSVNLMEMLTWIPSWSALWMILATFAVDTFFTISGFLMAYIFLKDMASGKKFNIFEYYIHRYVRLTPAFAALIIFTIYIAPHLGSGPIWEKNAIFEERACKKNWWVMLLYLHNYVNTNTQICLGHTWYLAAEMHFFWISPLILYPLAKKPKIGLGILAATFIASIITVVKIGYDHEFSTALVSNRDFDPNTGTTVKFYLVSHIRAAPWLVGIFFGYLVATQKGTKPSRVVRWIGWLLTILAFAFCIFTMRIFVDLDYEYEYLWEAFYSATVRPFWGFAVAWVIFACIRGFAGPITKLLSLPIYAPLSRISYSIYIVHMEIQFIKARAIRSPLFFTNFNAFNMFLSDFMLAIMIGFLFCLVFETPFMVLERIIKKRKRQAKSNQKKVPSIERAEKGNNSPAITAG